MNINNEELDSEAYFQMPNTNTFLHKNSFNPEEIEIDFIDKIGERTKETIIQEASSTVLEVIFDGIGSILQGASS